jgi:adenylate cyclase
MRIRPRTLAGVGLLLVLAAAGPAHAQQCADGTPPPCAAPAVRASTPAPNSIAVLYFDNLSRDSADTYIADGLTDEVIVRLQHVQRLDVKSRYEVRRFRGTRIADARSVGRELRVAYLVTGSVRPGASRMRVTYELVRTSDGRTLASDIVDTTAADQWAISNSVALAIARQVAGRLAPEERAALVRIPSRDAQAVDLYRRGTFLVERGIRNNRLDVVMSFGFFQAAIERDSAFADAWAAMADAWGWAESLFTNRFVAEMGRGNALRALALDSASGRAASALAYALMTVDYDWLGAERIARRTLERNTRSVELRLTLAEALCGTGRCEEASQEVREAWAIDSLNPRFPFYVVNVLASARRYDDLIRWSRGAGSMPGVRELGFVVGLVGAHRLDSALSVAGSTQNPLLQAIALAAAGRLSEAHDAAARLEAVVDSARVLGFSPANPDYEALAWAAAGDRDRAFAALERCYVNRSGGWLPFLKVYPVFDSLRDDPRYHDLLRRMHLEP